MKKLDFMTYHQSRLALWPDGKQNASTPIDIMKPPTAFLPPKKMIPSPILASKGIPLNFIWFGWKEG
jgi:hypothetical protein